MSPANSTWPHLAVSHHKAHAMPGAYWVPVRKNTSDNADAAPSVRFRHARISWFRGGRWAIARAWPLDVVRVLNTCHPTLRRLSAGWWLLSHNGA